MNHLKKSRDNWCRRDKERLNELQGRITKRKVNDFMKNIAGINLLERISVRKRKIVNEWNNGQALVRCYENREEEREEEERQIKNKYMNI